jgi:hypothetical protein
MVLFALGACPDSYRGVLAVNFLFIFREPLIVGFLATTAVYTCLFVLYETFDITHNHIFAIYL